MSLCLSSLLFHQQIVGSGQQLTVVVGPSTAGLYICQASVRGFPSVEGRQRVLVKGPPLIVSAEEQEGRMGDTVTLECSTVSVPSPIRITWTYNGREIDLSEWNGILCCYYTLLFTKTTNAQRRIQQSLLWGGRGQRNPQACSAWGSGGVGAALYGPPLPTPEKIFYI